MRRPAIAVAFGNVVVLDDAPQEAVVSGLLELSFDRRERGQQAVVAAAVEAQAQVLEIVLVVETARLGKARAVEPVDQHLRRG